MACKTLDRQNPDCLLTFCSCLWFSSGCRWVARRKGKIHPTYLNSTCSSDTASLIIRNRGRERELTFVLPQVPRSWQISAKRLFSGPQTWDITTTFFYCFIATAWGPSRPHSCISGGCALAFLLALYRAVSFQKTAHFGHLPYLLPLDCSSDSTNPAFLGTALRITFGKVTVSQFRWLSVVIHYQLLEPLP